MASSDIQSTMSTKIKVDQQEAANEVENLTNKFKDLTSQWKAEEAQAKASGDNVAAVKARYEGLQRTMELQRQKVEQLNRQREDQQRLIRMSSTVTKEQTDQLSNLDKSLTSATNRLTSLNNQQQRARRSYEYASSGLKELRNEYYNNSRAINSNVERLKAEGNTAEAQRAKLAGLRSSLANLTKQQSAAKRLADEAAASEGKNSNVYKRRITDYNKISAAIARTKNESKGLAESLNPPKTSAWTAIREKILGVNDAEERAAKTSERIKGVFSGAFLGNLTANILPTIQTQLHNIVTVGMQTAQTEMAMEARWKNLGVASGSVKQLSGQVTQLKENTNLTAESVNQLQTRFYGMTHSVSQTRVLTKGVASLADQLKLSDKQANAFASGLSRIESSGKVTSSSLGRLEKQAPGLMAAMSKASGMTQQQFKALVASGKMTTDQFNGYLQTAAKNYNKNSAAFSKSAVGAQHKLQQEWATTQAALAKPLVKVEATGLNQLSQALRNKDTQRGLVMLASGFAKLAVDAAKALAVLARHQKVVLALSGAFLTLVGTIKLVNGLRSVVLTFRHISDAIKTVTASTKLMGIAMNSLKFAGIVGGITLVITAFVELYKHSKTFRNFINGIVSGLKKLGKWFVSTGRGILRSASKLHKNLSRSWNNYWKQQSRRRQAQQKQEARYQRQRQKADQRAWQAMQRNASRGWKSIERSASNGTKRVGKWYDNLKRSSTRVVQNMARQHPRTFQSMYRVIQDRTRTWHDVVTGHWKRVGSDTERLAKDQSRANKDIFEDMYSTLNKKTDGWLGKVVDSWKDHMSKIGDAIEAGKKNAGHAMADLANGVLKPFKTLIDDIQSGINWVLDKIGASKLGGSWSAAIPTFATGTKENRDGLKKTTIGMVNDGAGAHWRELYSYKGKVGAFPNKKNFVTVLPKGMSILNGEDSHKWAQAFKIPGFANGVGDFFANLKDDVDDWTDQAEKIMAHPVEFMEHVFAKRLGGLSSGIKFAEALITHVPIYIAKQMVSWVKQQFETLSTSMDSNSTSPAATGDHRHWMKQAGIPESWFDSINYIVSHESGWRVNATNPGSGAYGLPQSLPGSKMAAAGRDWRTNPITQLKWMKSYVSSRYGGGPGAAAFWRSHHWYANGGLVSGEQIAHIAENNSPEMVIPLSAAKRGRAYQLLSEVMAQFKHEDSAAQPTRVDQPISQKDFKSLETKVDTLIEGISQLVQLGQQQIVATNNSGNKFGLKANRAVAYNVIGKDQRLNDYMSYRR